ncbi:MAG: hypothetical protein AB1758_24090, partial [Candidatus Eremiobacterota bacterium]
MVYRYRVLDRGSRSKEGWVEAESLDVARHGLEQQGFYIMELEEASSAVLEELERSTREEAAREVRRAARRKRRFAGLSPTWTRYLFHPYLRWTVRGIAVVGVAWALIGLVIHRPEGAGRRPGREVSLTVRGSVAPAGAPSETTVTLVFPEVPVRFRSSLLDLKAGPDG